MNLPSPRGRDRRLGTMVSKLKRISVRAYLLAARVRNTYCKCSGQKFLKVDQIRESEIFLVNGFVVERS